MSHIFIIITAAFHKRGALSGDPPATLSLIVHCDYREHSLRESLAPLFAHSIFTADPRGKTLARNPEVQRKQPVRRGFPGEKRVIAFARCQLTGLTLRSESSHAPVEKRSNVKARVSTDSVVTLR